MRELPDGGREFVLDEPTLSFIRIDQQSRLQFGQTEVVITGPFELQHDGAIHRLDPQRTEGLGPLTALFPGSMRWLWTSDQGVLTAEFHGGDRVTVHPGPVGRTWSVGSVYCLPSRPS